MSEEEFADRITVNIASLAFNTNRIFDAAVEYSRKNPGKHINVADYFNKYNGDFALQEPILILKSHPAAFRIDLSQSAG